MKSHSSNKRWKQVERLRARRGSVIARHLDAIYWLAHVSSLPLARYKRAMLSQRMLVRRLEKARSRWQMDL